MERQHTPEPQTYETWTPPSAREHMVVSQERRPRQGPPIMNPAWELVGEATSAIDAKSIRPLTEVIRQVAFGDRARHQAEEVMGEPEGGFPQDLQDEEPSEGTLKVDEEVSNLKAMFAMLDIPEEMLDETEDRGSPSPEAAAPEPEPQPPQEGVQISQAELDAAFLDAKREGTLEGERLGLEKVEPIKQQYLQGIEELANLTRAIRESMESDVVELTMALLLRILRQELALNEAHIEATIREVLHMVRREDSVKIQVSVQDYETLMSRDNRFWEESDEFGSVKIEPDEEIHLGGCYAEFEAGRIDARIDTQVEELFASLKGAVIEEKGEPEDEQTGDF